MRKYPEKINIRLTRQEKNILEKRCNDLHMELSDYVRMKLFKPDEINWEETKVRLKKFFIEEEK